MNIPLTRGVWLSLLLLSFLSLAASAQPNYVYVNDSPFGPNSVTALSVAPNGALTPVPGSPFLTGGLGTGSGFFAAVRINVTVVGSLLYVTNDGTNDISAFTINPATGVLTPVPGSPFPTGGFSTGGNVGGISLAVTPDNRFLYAANAGSSDTSIFSIAANGALTPIGGSPFPLLSNPNGIKLSPDGRFLAIAFSLLDEIGVYAVNANGTLTTVPGSPFFSPAAGGVTGVEINCAGTLLYAGQAINPGTYVDGFNIAPNGALSLVPGSPFSAAAGDDSNVVLLSNDEKFLFASNQFSSTVAVFNVAANGSLSPVAGSPFPTGAIFSTSMATNRAGNLLYVYSQGIVTVFNIAANGTLTQAPGSPFGTVQFGNGALAAFPSKSCSSFDLCVQDDANGAILQFDSRTGAYLFTHCRKGITLAGVGRVVKTFNSDFCKVELFDSGPDPKRPDRNVSALVNPCTGRGDAQVRTAGQTFTAGDNNIYNNTCRCQ
jgi:6-phosphogluconolactonase (cycloisomerase 2 family)